MNGKKIVVQLFDKDLSVVLVVPWPWNNHSMAMEQLFKGHGIMRVLKVIPPEPAVSHSV
jgi:hypothetical protein